MALAGLVIAVTPDPNAIMAAVYAEPTLRYGHFAAGRPHEFARIEASTARGGLLAYSLPPDEVFEDIRPRLVRFSPGAAPELLTIVSHRDAGSALALLGLEGGRLTVVARSKPIGTPMRWLNPVAVADLDGDGSAEVAAVVTPHIGGSLRIYRRVGRNLQEIASLDGFSNHIYGSSELGLATLWRDANGTRLLVLDTFRTALRVIEFRDGQLHEVGLCKLTAPVIGTVTVAVDATVRVGQRDGSETLRLSDCMFAAKNAERQRPRK